MTGLIETARVEAGRVPLWPLHLARLTASARALGLPPPTEPPDAAAVAAAAAGIASVAAVRVTLAGGRLQLQARAVPPMGPGWWACPAPAPRQPDPRHEHKTTDRADHVAAAAHAQGQGCQEALWLDAGGHLTEGTISNLFVCVAGRIQTPPGGGGLLLPGIARARLLRAGAVAGVPVVEAVLDPGQLLAADEVFVTNAVRGAIPLIGWAGRRLRTGALWRQATQEIFGV